MGADTRSFIAAAVWLIGLVPTFLACNLDQVIDYTLVSKQPLLLSWFALSCCWRRGSTFLCGQSGPFSILIYFSSNLLQNIFLVAFLDWLQINQS